MPNSSIRYLLQAFISVATLATFDTQAALPTGLIGSCIVSQIGHPPRLQEVAGPYEVTFSNYYQSWRDPKEAGGYDIVDVDIKAAAGEGCAFQVLGKSLIGLRNMPKDQKGLDQILCTSSMDAGGIEWRELCEQEPDRDACYQRVFKESELLESVLMTGNDIEWRRSKGRLIIYSPTDNLQIVLVPNPLR
jgi:hypothetical protein